MASPEDDKRNKFLSKYGLPEKPAVNFKTDSIRNFFNRDDKEEDKKKAFDAKYKLGSASGLKKPDLTTVGGLKSFAEGQGVDTSRLMGEKGEDPKKIFSGGFISDLFDVMNALQYGTVGLAKGKSFAEGVRTRQSFSDKDALGENGIPGVIAGIALDIAFDPLTYVGGLGIGKATLKGIKGAGRTAGAMLQKIPAAKQVGEQLGRMFIYRFGQDPVYAKIAERMIRNTNTGAANLLELSKPLTSLDSKTQKVIAEARKAGKLADLPDELLIKAKPAFDELDRLGYEAVKEGLLDGKTYEENVGKYIARLYRSKEAPEGVVSAAIKGKAPKRIDLSRFKKREDIPEDVREAMGEILEAGYPTAKGLVQLQAAVEKSKFFREVATKWGSDVAEEGLKKLPETKSLGQLAGKFVPRPIFDDIQELVRVPTAGERKLGKVVAGFKFGKVIMNPPTHARNIMANFILNDFEGLSPARLDIYALAAKEMVKKGPHYQEAAKLGLGVDTFAANELKTLFNSPEATSWMKRGGQNIAKKLSSMYQGEEQFAKLAQFIFQKSKGKTAEEAIEIAERATFNYSQVTPFIRRVRESLFGYPFVTFSYKVTPQVARTAITKPGKISKIGKIKNAIENQSNPEELAAERAVEPDYIRDGFYVKMPIKDKHGRSAYLDLTYILPFGDLLGGQFLERGIKRETGLPEGPAPAAIHKLPFFSVIKELGSNQDFYGNKIWKESDSTEKQLGDVMRHLTKQYAPPVMGDLLPNGYRADGSRRPTTLNRLTGGTEAEQIESGGFQGRTLEQEMLRYMGLKISPFDLEMQTQFMDREQRRALETMLLERGDVAQFSRTFVPNPKTGLEAIKKPGEK